MLEDFIEEQRYKNVEDQFSDDEVNKEAGGRYFDSKYAEFAHVSQVTLPIDRIPEDIMSRAHKVFSKHNSKEVREWSRQLMKSYQLLHAIEKPMNLDFVKPFANTSDLKEFAPNIDFNLAEERKKERDFKLKKNH
jgi:hypothetical protein